MAAIIYSKLLCPYCEMAKKLLDEKKIPYKEIIIGVDLTKKEAFKELDKVFTTAPQIVIDGIHVGGYTDLLEYFKKKNQYNGEPK
jgi:glutaredoxin 3